jgi:hypothetical protein
VENTPISTSINTGLERHEFKPLKMFYTLLLWFIVAIVSLHIISNLMQFFFPVAIRSPETGMFIVQLLIALLVLGLEIAAGVYFFLWVYRACDNLYALGNLKLKYSPGWAVAWFFIPFANLVMPYLAMADILKRSAIPGNNAIPDGQSMNKPTPIWIILWWAIFIIRLVLTLLVMAVGMIKAFSFAIRGDFSSYANGMENYQFFFLGLELVHAVITILMLRQITNLQEARSGK